MFTDSLEILLKLNIDNHKFDIPCGNIKYLECKLYQYGFICTVNFWFSSELKVDKLYPLFTTDKLIEVQLNVSAHFKDKDNDKKIKSIILSGSVTKKAILDELIVENLHLKKNPVLYRYYQIIFKDNAQVFLKQHFPTDLKVNKKIKELFINNTPSKVNIEYNWSFLDKEITINTLPLGSLKNQASFYDFIIWFANKYNGLFLYDYSKDTFYLTDKKISSNKIINVDKEKISSYSINFLEQPRYTIEVLNANAENVQKKQIKYPSSLDNIEKTLIIDTPIVSEYDNFINIAKKKTKTICNYILKLKLNKFYNIPIYPNSLLKFSGKLWSKEQFIKDKTYRIRQLYMKAEAVNQEADSDINMPYNKYDIQTNFILESQDDESITLPEVVEPYYPLLVEGYVVSETGRKDEDTYQIYQHSKTSIDHYKVAIPLFNNQQVWVPFEPIFFSGQFYFPLYRGARVLVALYLHKAYIKRILDWKDGVRLPLDTQGNHILLGKNAESQTSISHIYTKNEPVLKIVRTNKNDTQILQINEGTIILETKEKSE